MDQTVAILGMLGDEGFDALPRGNQLRVRRNRNPPFSERRIHSLLACQPFACFLRDARKRPDSVGDKRQRPHSGLARILLAQRTGSRIARIGVLFLPCLP